MMKPKRSPSHPDCYGNLGDEHSELCSSCLLRDACLSIVRAGTGNSVAAPAKPVASAPIAGSKKAQIIQICHKFGIPTNFWNSKEGRQVEVEGYEDEYMNIDFLLTNKAAFQRFLEY